MYKYDFACENLLQNNTGSWLYSCSNNTVHNSCFQIGYSTWQILLTCLMCSALCNLLCFSVAFLLFSHTLWGEKTMKNHFGHFSFSYTISYSGVRLGTKVVGKGDEGKVESHGNIIWGEKLFPSLIRNVFKRKQ